MRSRGLVAGLVAAVALTVLRVGVAPAETCPRVTAADARAAAAEAVVWFAANQRLDGSFAYLLDESGNDLGGYSITRHAGVLLSLYQAATAGIDDAVPVAERGLEWAMARLEPAGGGLAFGSGTSGIPTGASALLLAALDERRAALADANGADLEDTIVDLTTFLAAMVEPSGAVAAEWDTNADRPVPDRYSVFFTGEALWALARVGHPAADVIAAYMPRRDDAEDRFPPTSDHWAAYAWAELASAGALTEEQRDYAHRMAGIFGVEVRVESTRWAAEGPVRWTRRGPASGSGLGTLGEGSAALLRALGDDAPDGLAERTACAAGMLVARQADGSDPAQRGAWFAGGVTRMDDQQHAMSALLAAGPALEAVGRTGATTPVGDGEEPWGLAVVAVALLAAMNPLRYRRTDDAVALGAAAWAGIVALAALSGPIVDGLTVSPASLRFAAGVVLAVTSAVGLVAARGAWTDGLAIAATLVVAVAAGADDGVAVAAGAVPAVAAVAGLPDRFRRPLTARLAAAVGVVVAVRLAVEGVFSV